MRYPKDQLRNSRLVVREVKPDGKKRVTLGKALEGYPAGVQFSVYRNEQGQLILDPLVAVPAREAWLFSSPEALAAVRRGLGEGARGETEELGSVARFADEA